MNLKILSNVVVCAAVLMSAQATATECEPKNPQAHYPSSVIADYVLGCMLSNGTSPDLLRKCACSIDYIAESIPYEDYEAVVTLMQLQQMPGGGRVAVYKQSHWAKNAIAHLREVQAESTLRCF